MVVMAFSSCDPDHVENYLHMSKDSVSFDNTGQFLAITSSESWTIELEFSEDEIDQWCSLSPTSGTGNKSNIALSYSKNEGDNPRSVIIRVLFEKEVIENRFVQGEYVSSGGGGGGGGGTPSSLKSDQVNSWMELPQVEIGSNQAYISHYANVGGKNVRNFSMLYDANSKIALWIAYPLCSMYLGSGGRSDAWEYDSKIPSEYQPMLYSGFPSMTGVTGYDRGHQLPSADRTSSTAANRQTFYFSNMTPQNSSLNQGVWAKLETMVRGYTSSCDTLYVITGPVLKTSSSQKIDYLYSRGTSNIFTAIPKAYFKVLLKYKVSTGTFSCIGFWYENKSYGYNAPKLADVQTVKEIENRTGLSFFNNLPLTPTQLASLKNEFAPSSWGL